MEIFWTIATSAPKYSSKVLLQYSNLILKFYDILANLKRRRVYQCDSFQVRKFGMGFERVL